MKVVQMCVRVRVKEWNIGFLRVEYRVFECDEEQELNKIQTLVVRHLLGT